LLPAGETGDPAVAERLERANAYEAV